MATTVVTKPKNNIPVEADSHLTNYYLYFF